AAFWPPFDTTVTPEAGGNSSSNRLPPTALNDWRATVFEKTTPGNWLMTISRSASDSKSRVVAAPAIRGHATTTAIIAIRPLISRRFAGRDIRVGISPAAAAQHEERHS